MQQIFTICSFAEKNLSGARVVLKPLMITTQVAWSEQWDRRSAGTGLAYSRCPITILMKRLTAKIFLPEALL